MSDPAKYRTKEEVKEYQDRDPIKMIEKTILDGKIATKEEINAIQEEIKIEIDQAYKFADESPLPDPAELYTDNYLQEDYPFLT